MSGSRRQAAAQPVSNALTALVGDGAITADPLQAEAARTLDRIAAELGATRGSRGLLGRLIKPEPVRGAYLVGAVGRGKTMLMDLFYGTAEVDKRRLHFNEFMDEVHAQVADFRRRPGSERGTDPVATVANGIGKSIRLICLDEFQVEDITNAMILGRLFGALFHQGVTLVATSNTQPDELYRDGLNRQLVLPFIAELKARVAVVPLDGPTDYRRQKFEGERVFVFGTDAAAATAMDRLWLRLTGGLEGEPATVESLGRSIRVPRVALGAARFSFAELCEAPLGARDYLRLAHAFDTLVIDGVPQFSRTTSNAAKRFIVLIDTLYDRGIKLAARFDVPLEDLGHDERTADAFRRTASRLAEMQSAAYLEAPHKTEAVHNF